MQTLPRHAALSTTKMTSLRELEQELEEELHLLAKGYNRRSPPLGLIEAIGFNTSHGG